MPISFFSPSEQRLFKRLESSRLALIWAALAVIVAVPLYFAATSPLLQWRQPIYIIAGFAGVVAMVLLLVQPLLAGQLMPGINAAKSRRIHQWVGSALVAFVLVHIAGLWITSPPDVIDALLFRSPTPFSAWGVIAMWAVFAAALLAVFRARLRLHPRTWRRVHLVFVAITVIGSVVHAVLIEGTMETVSKVVLCGLVVLVLGWAVFRRPAIDRIYEKR